MRTKVKWLSLLLVAFSLTATAGPVWKKGAAIPVVTEGATCNAASDKVGVTSGNVVLSCQSGRWVNASRAAGGYTFRISGNSYPRFYGIGRFDQLTGTFSGDLKCDPETVSAYCGFNGHSYCGASNNCAWGNAYTDGIGSEYYTVTVSGITVDSVVQKW